ncbi:hypothetical protein RFM41_03085 [Mesorhizobium sp. VK25A]|uniref:Uncharacterized protein n=1 Tax=Mesorhizobium vachelliae TaxID=3072309 RepID=A0ABU5A2H3_9HYPH|nr:MULTISPECIES: hypothetical protein [unclassified Mesorhizobium]MDX8530724.1 hypothetical protein [Mesorhizobium sp. VK25D]MDX8542701.1 hypothetical protein [Mesorhizobium sp. VK25A]
MSRHRFALLTIVACSIAALPSLAAAEGSSYVYCSNGIVCVKAPCPSGDALDLTTGTVIKGVAIDTTRLPLLDRAAVDFPDKLHAGKIVVRGSIQHRDGEHSLPWLVATGVERAAKQSERKHCSAR